MSVSSTTNRVIAAGNGITTAFPFPYYFLARADLVVTLTDSSGNVTSQILDTDYSVTGTTSTDGTYKSGGTVTFTSAPASGLTVSIVRVPPVTQATHWTDSDTNKELAFDKVTLLLQRALDLVGRSIKLKDGFVGTFDGSLPKALTPNYAIAINGTGDGLQLLPVSNPANGTVTSVGLSAPGEITVGSTPVTTSGVIALSWASQAANKIFAGPTSGGSNTPGFRSLVASDLPLSSINVTSLTSGAATNGKVPMADGAGNITWQNPPGSGTVTSVALSLPAMFTVSGSPVTTTGTLSATLASQAQSTFFAAPAGSNGAPSFRQIAVSDLPLMSGASSGSDGAAGLVTKPLTGQQGLFLRGDGAWAAVPQGTVTSVDLVTPAEFTVSGDPVTGAGTLTVSKATQAANKVWAGPTSGIAAQPTFRSLVANDYPVMTGSTALASGVRGAVPAPSAGQQNLYLKGDGSWGNPVTASGGSSATIVTTDYTVIPTDNFIVVNSASLVNVTLPDATPNDGMQLTIKQVGTGGMNILTTGGQTIDGMANLNVTAQYTSTGLKASQGGWYLW